MKNLVYQLKQIIPFKDTAEVGDVVLIAAKEPETLFYAVITNIERDPGRKDEWWILDFSLLSIPIRNMQWTLRLPQMTGVEIFTMDGKERFMKAVNLKETPSFSASLHPKKEKKNKKRLVKRIK